MLVIMGLGTIILLSSDLRRRTLCGIIVCACVASLVLLELEDARTLLRSAKSPEAIKRLPETEAEAPTKLGSPNLEPRAASTPRVSGGGPAAGSNGQQYLVPVSAGESTCRKLRLSDHVRP
jgi:hypothetical protein